MTLPTVLSADFGLLHPHAEVQARWNHYLHDVLKCTLLMRHTLPYKWVIRTKLLEI